MKLSEIYRSLKKHGRLYESKLDSLDWENVERTAHHDSKPYRVAYIKLPHQELIPRGDLGGKEQEQYRSVIQKKLLSFFSREFSKLSGQTIPEKEIGYVELGGWKLNELSFMVVIDGIRHDVERIYIGSDVDEYEIKRYDYTGNHPIFPDKYPGEIIPGRPGSFNYQSTYGEDSK